MKLKKIARTLLAAGLLAGAAQAHAVIIDFKAAAEPTGLGESAWTVFNVLTHFGFDIRITGVKGAPALIGAGPYAYLDSNKAGMGVCGTLTATGLTKLDTATGSGANLCNPGSDDNITTDEGLNFEFNEAVVISKVWFNNNHDGDRSLIGDTISVLTAGNVLFTALDVDASRGGDVVYAVPMSFSANSVGAISYVNEEFYLSAIEISRVPEPGTLALLGVAFAGFIGFARRRNTR